MLSVNFIKFLDKYFGSLLCLLLSINKFFIHKETKEHKKILIIQLWGLGETILTLPAINALKQYSKRSNIDILATSRNKEVFYNNKNINNIRILKLNPLPILIFIIGNYRKYDLVIDMEEYLNISSIICFFTGKDRTGYAHGIRSNLYTKKVEYNDKQHTAETFLDLIRKLNIKYKINNLERLNYSKKDKNTVDEFLKDKKVTNKDIRIGIAPGAAESGRARMWPWKNYVKLCNNVLKKNKKIKIIFIGNKDETELIKKIQNGIEEKSRTINAGGLFELSSLFCLIEKCNLFIGNDSGPMHIAAAQGVKTIGLFGPNLPIRFGPYGKNNISVYNGHNCKFSPCINVHKGQVPDCLYAKKGDDYQKCMKNIKVNDVLKFIR